MVIAALFHIVAVLIQHRSTSIRVELSVDGQALVASLIGHTLLVLSAVLESLQRWY